MRTWSDASGKFQRQAVFVELKDGTVYLQLKDGAPSSVAFDRLSRADQEYVRQQVPAASIGEDPFRAPGEKVDAASEIDRATTALCEQIDKSYRGKEGAAKPRIAVVEFTDSSWKVTELGRILSEELITKLFLTEKYDVVERFLLKKVVEEHKLIRDGILDPNSAKELGKVLGVDAVVTGTIAEVGDTLRVNARVISADTGEIFSAAAASLPKEVVAAPRPEPSPGQPGTKNGELVFHEDFSTYEEGDLPDWGDGVSVQVGQDGRKWLVASERSFGFERPKRRRPVGKNVTFPDDSWYLEFDFTARVAKEPNSSWGREGFVTSSISLVDEQARAYRIGWQIHPSKHVFVLPDGTGHETELGTTRQDHDGHGLWLKGRTLRFDKKADLLGLFIDGKPALSADLKGFGKFARFEVEVCLHNPYGYPEYLYFTNFKVGRL